MSIENDIQNSIQNHLNAIEQQHAVTLLYVIESGSRAWGFPSPDSDYDVRFIYAHAKDWYLQLTPERDVIEVPINPLLDINGWDIRKAMNLANGGNTIVHEWLNSPLVYRQHPQLASGLRAQLGKTFNAIAAYHHYYSMAKGMADAMQAEQIKLKRFFYFCRTTLSAHWIREKHSMPPIEFKQLLAGLTDDAAINAAFAALIRAKASMTEAEVVAVDTRCLAFVNACYTGLPETGQSGLKATQQALGNQDLRELLTRIN